MTEDSLLLEVDVYYINLVTMILVNKYPLLWCLGYLATLLAYLEPQKDHYCTLPTKTFKKIIKHMHVHC